jgi:hypothetical protein
MLIRGERHAASKYEWAQTDRISHKTYYGFPATHRAPSAADLAMYAYFASTP